jgi:hypothetical protein
MKLYCVITDFLRFDKNNYGTTIFFKKHSTATYRQFFRRYYYSKKIIYSSSGNTITGLGMCPCVAMGIKIDIS